MSTLPTIHQLRRAGYKVKLDHTRRVLFPSEIDNKLAKGHPAPTTLHNWIVTRRAKKACEFGYIDPKGGKTALYVGTPAGVTDCAVANCNNKDRFDRRLGTRICIGRLVAKGVIPAVVTPLEATANGG